MAQPELVKHNFLLRGICDSRTLIVQVLIGAVRGLLVSILVIRNFALTEFALARLHGVHEGERGKKCHAQSRTYK